ncbi:hypothetical protein ACFQ1M_10295 [Sungkyunkwania multivorans]|uniref:ABM domain-containing protein n=1 Tax=Sungkyunkwania multivorans TaxID=1173618 RepID=A0ABW3D0D1_9FLAO
MERIVIVGYKPLKGKEEELKQLAKSHWNSLHDLGLVTHRKPIVMEAEGGTIVEVFGWKSKMAMEKAHADPEVLKMWKKYAEVCEYIPIGMVEEAQQVFSEFNSMNID